jgi:hypothetical protein
MSVKEESSAIETTGAVVGGIGGAAAGVGGAIATVSAAGTAGLSARALLLASPQLVAWLAVV